MQRREFITLIGGAAAAWPRRTLAQQNLSRTIPVIGFVGFATSEVDSAALEPFRKALTDLGYVEGRNVIIDARSTGGDVARGLALIMNSWPSPWMFCCRPDPPPRAPLCRR